MIYSKEAVRYIMMKELKIEKKKWSPLNVTRHFISAFGTDEVVVARVWEELHKSGHLPKRGKPKHLLWMLAYFKQYNTFVCLSRQFGVADSTMRSWVWCFAEAVAGMEHIIQWENRLLHDNGSICKVTVDGTDFSIFEPEPFDTIWFSHKFKGPGLRYEIGICIQTGHIVWANGPFPPGLYPDIKISRETLVNMVDVGEMILADGGYRDSGVYHETPSGRNTLDQRMKKVARARHETINSRIRIFGILNHRYRLELDKHFYVFHAIANIIQLNILEGRKALFQVYYDDNEIIG